MRSTRPARTFATRVAGVVIAGAFVLAACGGGDDSSTVGDGTRAPAPADEVELDIASDVAANQLPDVVVDNVTLGNKVNLRNVAPADTPILLWMWAPH